jgi:hypothetical protein
MTTKEQATKAKAANVRAKAKKKVHPANAGVFYLLWTGDLIWKPKHQSEEVIKYNQTHEVKRFWLIPEDSPTNSAEGDIQWVLSFLYQSFLLGAKKEDICSVIRRMGFQDTDSIYLGFILQSEKRKSAKSSY